MDLNRIFGEFKKGVGTKDRQHNVGILDDNPIVLIGMFKKIIVNNVFFNKKIGKLFNYQEVSFTKQDLAKASEFIVYHRAWYYISNIDLSREMDLDAIKALADEDFKFALEKIIQFFENIEEYERCAFLKQIHEKVLLSLAKDVPS